MSSEVLGRLHMIGALGREEFRCRVVCMRQLFLNSTYTDTLAFHLFWDS